MIVFYFHILCIILLWEKVKKTQVTFSGYNGIICCTVMCYIYPPNKQMLHFSFPFSKYFVF